MYYICITPDRNVLHFLPFLLIFEAAYLIAISVKLRIERRDTFLDSTVINCDYFLIENIKNTLAIIHKTNKTKFGV